MTKEFEVWYSFRMKGHYAIFGADAPFYHSLPNREEKYWNSETGRPEIPRPDTEQLITVLGSAVLSSTALAGAIKAWLEFNKTRITISLEGSKKTIKFEGPNLKASVTEIEHLINALSDETGAKSLNLHAQDTGGLGVK